MVFDTNVFAYALLGPATFGVQAAAVLQRYAGRIWAPETVRAELLSVAWQHVRAGLALPEAAHAAIDDLERLVDRMEPTVPLLHRALELAITHQHSPYDTLFVAFAERDAVKVVTFDAPLRAKFPLLTVAPEELLAGTADVPLSELPGAPGSPSGAP